MYISKICIKDFRNFKDSEIMLNDGINVIIGPNNSGKTNLLKALSLVIDYQGSKRLDVEDLNKNVQIEGLQDNPPMVKIQLTISQSKDEDLNSDDLATVGDWLTKLEAPYEALLTYKFFLPEKHFERYKKSLKEVTKKEDAWRVIQQDFIRFYTYKIFGGDEDLQNVADGESLQKFDFQFLDAIRDVQRDMFTGRNTLLREVLDFFIDYEIKNDDEKNDDEKREAIKEKRDTFSTETTKLLDSLQKRMENGKEHILSYADKTGASFNNATPNFEGLLSEVEMFSALKLIVKHKTGITVPATHNGLGYNNLIYMSLLLAKMQVMSDGDYLDMNAKIFPILAIEEPEAHLHPSMQYKFLKFLRENKDIKKKVRQVFVTSHSTQITSAVLLDEIICLYNKEDNELAVGYPGRAFSSDDAGEKSKAYVQRFLDATKSDMLFAQKVILVEGLAEQLLIPILAEYCSQSLEDYHISVINIGGRHFDHFLHLFDSQKLHTLPKRIACVTDRDPERKLRSGGKFEQCYPYEYMSDQVNYEYKNNSEEKINKYQSHQNIRFFSQDTSKGKTFEYDLALFNHDNNLLITESISNRREIEKLMRFYRKEKTVGDFCQELRNSKENDRISDIEKTSWGDEDKKKAIIASRYLNSVEKGENAFELSYVLKDNLSGKREREEFTVPQYIQEAIEWICQ